MVLADLNPGLDNLTFADNRLFVSNFTGEITEILADGQTQTVLPGGLNFSLSIRCLGSDGNLYIADGTYFYLLLPDHTLHTVGMLFTPGYPGFLRGLTPSGPGEFVVTTSGGQVSRYRPASGESEVLADGFDQLYGVAIAPDGTVAAAELGTGRVISIRNGRVEAIASGLNDPIGVAIAPDGSWLVSEAGAGRVVKLTVIRRAHGCGRIGPARKAFWSTGGSCTWSTPAPRHWSWWIWRTRQRTPSRPGLPVGAAPGVVPKPLKGMPPFSGPQGPFAGIAMGPDGTLYVSADADGSVLALQREPREVSHD